MGFVHRTFQKVGVFVRNFGSEATSYSDTTPLRTCQVNRHYISNTFLVKSSGHFSEAEICVFFAGGAEAKLENSLLVASLVGRSPQLSAGYMVV